MQIISVPHPTLRTQAEVIQRVDKKLLNFTKELAVTLTKTDNPKGIGLAAPQVDKSWRLFATAFTKKDASEVGLTATDLATIQIYLNPRLTQHSYYQELGPNDEDYTLEGCLSIPKLYGPAPRWQWVEVEYDIILNEELVTRSTRFSAFAARVMQHELDHLDGILFTDYSLEYDLPVYIKDLETKKMVELKDRSILETF